jgi:catechol 2,3-dioxygenase-like lactoylglutathione lyase family enzyme
MAGFTFSGIDHVNVTAPDELMEDVLNWYSDILGLEPVDKPEGTKDRGGWFKAGTQEIHVSVDPHNPPQSAHFGLVVDDSTPAVEALRAAGCHIEQASIIPGRHRFFTRDPAGNKLEIISFDGDA